MFAGKYLEIIMIIDTSVLSLGHIYKFMLMADVSNQYIIEQYQKRYCYGGTVRSINFKDTVPVTD